VYAIDDECDLSPENDKIENENDHWSMAQTKNSQFRKTFNHHQDEGEKNQDDLEAALKEELAIKRQTQENIILKYNQVCNNLKLIIFKSKFIE